MWDARCGTTCKDTSVQVQHRASVDARACALQLMIPRGTPEGKLLRKAGIMSIVEKGGPVLPDDPITVMLPPEPHQKLVVV